MFTADKSLTPLRLLLVEDSTQDAEALVQQLRRAGYDPAVKRVETPDELEALKQKAKEVAEDPDADVEDAGGGLFDDAGNVTGDLDTDVDEDE